MKNAFEEQYNKRGKPCENEVFDYIQKFYPDLQFSEQKDSGKDMFSESGKRSWEVKDCREAKIDVPIEVYNITPVMGKKNTGLSVTTSTYWVIFCKNLYHMIITETLRKLVKDIPVKEYHLENKMVGIKILSIVTLKNHVKHTWAGSF